MDDEQIQLSEVVAAMDPEGRLHFEIGQLRVAVKRLQRENAELRNTQAAGTP